MISLLTFLVACAPQPATVTIDGPPSITVHNLEAVKVPAAKVAAADGTDLTKDHPVAWSIEPADIATLDATTGMITPKAEGSATVTATVGTLKATWNVVVGLPDAVAVEGLAAGDVLNVGDTKTLTGSVTDNGAPIEGMAVTWESQNPEIATVSPEGAVSAVAPGAATIVAKSGDLTNSLSITVQAAALVDGAAPAPM